MRVKTIKRFKDKHTGKVHKVDDVFTVNKERFAEIIKEGKFVEEFVEDASNETEAKGD